MHPWHHERRMILMLPCKHSGFQPSNRHYKKWALTSFVRHHLPCHVSNLCHYMGPDLWGLPLHVCIPEQSKTGNGNSLGTRLVQTGSHAPQLDSSAKQHENLIRTYSDAFFHLETMIIANHLSRERAFCVCLVLDRVLPTAEQIMRCTNCSLWAIILVLV